MQNVKFIIPVNCTNLNQTSTSYCLPSVVSCNVEPQGLLDYCDRLWNCNPECQVDTKYWMAFQVGDKIQIQTQFYDTDNGINSLTVDYDAFFDTVTFCGDVNNFTDTSLFACRKMIAFKNGKSYQILEIDTSLFTDTSFSISFTKGQRTVCTQHFRLADECDSTITLKSSCTKIDCFNYCYGQPDSFIGDNIEYDNTIRIFGSIVKSGFGTEIIEQGKTTKGIIRDNYSVYFKGKVPDYMAEIISKQMMNCGKVIVDGIEYKYESFSISDADRYGGMWKFSLNTLYLECDNHLNVGC